MEIKIVKYSELNNCLASLQYTNRCFLCDKVFTCRIKSDYHKEGIEKASKMKQEAIKEQYEHYLLKHVEELNKALKTFK